MTQYLPANLLALFAPRDPLPYLPPPEPKHSKEVCNLVGVGEYVNLFEDPVDTPAPRKVLTRAERKEIKRVDKEDKQKNYIEEELSSWDPHNDANAAGDAFKTVFVARINFDTREDKLKREFEEFGPIRHIHMVTDTKTCKPRGYAFIEYETERGMRSAFKYGDGRKIDGKRVVVDIERGRTVKNWRPRRLGGGLGGTRIGAPDQNITHSGRVEPREYQEKLTRATRQRERALRRSRTPSAEKDRSRRGSNEPVERILARATSTPRERSPRKEEKKKDEREDRGDRRDDRRRDRGDRDRDRDRRREGRDRGEDRGDRRRDDRRRDDDRDKRRDDDERKRDRNEDDKKRGDDVVQDDKEDKSSERADRPNRDRGRSSDKRDRDEDRRRDRDEDRGDRDRKRGREDRDEREETKMETDEKYPEKRAENFTDTAPKEKVPDNGF